MNTKYNPNIRLVEHNWSGPFQTFIANNRPFLSDDAVDFLSRELSQNGRAEFDAGSKVIFHFEVI